jgi:hypothetical protein
MSSGNAFKSSDPGTAGCRGVQCGFQERMPRRSARGVCSMMPGAHQASVFKISYDLLPIEDRIGLIQSDIEDKVPIKSWRDSGMTNLS